MSLAEILVADVGGTNTRLAVAGAYGVKSKTVRRYKNAEFDSLEAVIATFLRTGGYGAAHHVCLAVAAPIEGGSVTLTNREWQFSRASIAEVTGALDVELLNDFEALGFSIAVPEVDNLIHIAGPDAASKGGARMVLGAGTGFNAATLHRGCDGALQVHAAECGHMTLMVEGADDLRLRDHLARNRGRASVERALSGQGLTEIFDWVCRDAGIETPALSAPQIVDGAFLDTDPQCLKACEILTHWLGRVVGDLALAFLPTGGIYLSGGVTRGCAPLIRRAAFWDAFCAKGRQTQLMRGFPIYLLNYDCAALNGCYAALRHRGTALTEGDAA